MKKKVVLIFTGGTISMQVDPVVGAAIPVLSGEQILVNVPSLDEIVDFEISNFAKLPGPHMTPGLMLELAEVVKRMFARDDICGAVITHGTDTLEETAYCLDLLIDSPKPVAVVGAMRNSSELGWDGPPNLIAAVRTVTCEAAWGLGVLVVLNDEINAASEVTKTHTESMGTFQSPDFGLLGIVDKDRVLILRRPAFHEHIATSNVDTRVDLIKMAAGIDDRLIRYAIDSGAHGLVIEALGRGNIPSYALPGIEYAIGLGLPVVIVSRCLRGRVLDTYGYKGGGHELRQMGAILGGYLSGQKARIKLMLALGRTKDVDEIRDIFEHYFY
ncbi:MAG: asparaginase [Acidobacteriota bacterium]